MTDNIRPDSIRPEETIVPKWVSVSAHYIRLGLALFLLASVAIGLISCSASPESSWQPYSPLLTKAEVAKIYADNSMLDEGQVTDELLGAVRVQLIDGVILVDLNDEDLCGFSDCLYLGFEDGSLREVFRAYLNPNIPPEYALFEPSDRTSDQASCFLINQVDGSDVDGHTMCFDGAQYSEVNVQSRPSRESTAGAR